MHASYHGVEVYECAPNGQGLTALAALAMLDGLSPAVGSCAHGSAAHLHPLIEALRLAFADSRWFVADPEHVEVPTDALLSPAYVAARRARIAPAKATADAHRGAPEQQSNTVSFQVVDAAGCAVSMVNSNFCGFGTAIVPHGCGFSLQNRGSNFALEPEHPNALAAGKRPFHTIIPAIVLKGGALFASLTNMGGFMQPQGHVQHVVHLVRDALDPQAAIDAPRFCIPPDDSAVDIEPGFDAAVYEGLVARGHPLRVARGYERVVVGRATIILRTPDGVLWGASDGRADGCAIGY